MRWSGLFLRLYRCSEGRISCRRWLCAPAHLRENEAVRRSSRGQAKMKTATKPDAESKLSAAPYHRVVLKLSGESFAPAGERGISMQEVMHIAGQTYRAKQQ